MRSKSVIMGFLFSAVLSANAFEGNNDPKFINPNFNHKFYDLPLEGHLSDDKTPWASSFWPHIYGGIAFRWNDYYKDGGRVKELQLAVGKIKDQVAATEAEIYTNQLTQVEITDHFNDIIRLNNKKFSLLNSKTGIHQKVFFSIARPQTLEEVKIMSQVERDQLSPAEKYDIYKALINGRGLSNKLTRDVLDLTGPESQYWEGICNGWSSAAVEFHEPRPQSISIDGITLNFGSSDLKALLSYYHSALTKNYFAKKYNNIGRVGERCKTEFTKDQWFLKDNQEYYKTLEKGKVIVKKVPAACVDTDPGAFHIVLANQVGKLNKGFVAEVVRDKEVWNQPVYGYETEVLKSLRTTFGERLHVKTVMHYANDGGRMYWEQDDPEEEFYAWWEATNGTSNYRGAEKTFEYYLDINRQGNIIGGMWLSYERPDFIWVKKSKGFLAPKSKYGIASYMNELKNLVEVR